MAATTVDNIYSGITSNDLNTELNTANQYIYLDAPYKTITDLQPLKQRQDSFKDALNIQFPTVNDSSKIKTVLVHYLLYRYAMIQYSQTNITSSTKASLLQLAAESINKLIIAYRSTAGGSLQQIYNAQGLVTDLAATNDQISGATNAPPAFSAGHTTEAISFDMLSPSMLNALTPTLSTAGGAWPSSYKKAPKKSKR